MINQLNEITELENELDAESVCQYNFYCEMYVFGDLETETKMKLDWLKERIEKLTFEQE